MKNNNFPQRKLNRPTWYFCLLALLVSAAPLCAQSSSDITPTLEVPAPMVVPTAAIGTVSHWHKWHTHHKKTHAAMTSATKTAASEQAPNSIATVVREVPLATMAAQTAPVAPLDMTRDAGPAPVRISSQPIHDAGRLDVTAELLRMLGSLLLVLVIILAVVRLLKKYNLVPSGGPKGILVSAPTAGADKLPSSKDVLAWMTGSKPDLHSNADVVGRPISEFLGDAGGPPSFKLISSLNLPGSNSSVHLVQAAQRLLVLGTSQSGATTLLTEVPAATLTEGSPEPEATTDSAEVEASYQPPVERYVRLDDGLLPIIPKPAAEIEEDDTSDDDIIAFAEILRQKAGLSSIADRSDVLALDGIDARLNATQDRLNDRIEANSKLAASNSSITPTTTRRRRATKSTRTDGAE
jgi:flagellar biogenesis protein FliO